MIAVLEAYKAGLFTKAHWVNNIIAGVIVGVVALPLAMAFAIASGVTPERGLYTAIVAGLLTTVLGGSRLQISGPTGAFVAILAGITMQYGLEGLQIATIMAGLIMLVMGVARLGGLMKYIPQPVIVGFTAGIGIIIWVGQWKDFFGLKPEAGGAHFHEKFMHLIDAFPTLSVPTTLLALLSLCIVFMVPRISFMKRVPGPLIAMIVATLIQAFVQFPDVATIGSAFGGIPRSLPHFEIPGGITMNRIVELAGPAFAIAMLGSIESLLSATVADGMAGTKFNPNQELKGQGLANIITPFFGGFAATGAIARTATNIRNGATGPLAGIVHCLTLVAIVLLLAPLAAYVPLCALAAILFMVAWNMSELHHVVHMVRHAPKSDVAILLLTLILTVFVDLVMAVEVGVLLAALLFMQRMSGVVDAKPEDDTQLQPALAAINRSELPKDIMVYTFDGPLFFGAADVVDRLMGYAINPAPRVVVLRMGNVPYIDATGLEKLSHLIGRLQKSGAEVILSETTRKVAGRLDKGGVIAKLGEGRLFDRLDLALAHAIDKKEA